MEENKVIKEEQKVVAIYTRVSTVDQSREGHSLEEQEKRLKQLCNINNYKVYKVYTDAGISGKSADNRPSYQNMLADMKGNKFNLIMSYKMDRLSRSVADFEELFKETSKYNCGIELLQEKVDTSDATGMLFARMLAIFSQFERDMTRERTLLGVEGAINKGHIGGKPSLGYMSSLEKDDNGNRIKRWIVNEEEAIIVRDIFDLCLQGNSYFQISKIIKEKYPKVVTTRKLNKQNNELEIRYRTWTDGTISRILNNKHYIGIHDFRKTVENKDTIEIKGIVPQIINENIFFECQKNIQRNQWGYLYEKDYLFQQKVFCSNCGKMLACNGTRKKNGKEYLYYKCKDCNEFIREEEIEKCLMIKLNELIELHFALDDSYFPIDNDLSEELSKCKGNHKIRFIRDERIISDMRECQNEEEFCKIWNLATTEIKKRFIYEYIDEIKVKRYIDKKSNNYKYELKELILRKNKIEDFMTLSKKNMIDEIYGCGKYKISQCYMSSDKEAREYIELLKKRYNIGVHEYSGEILNDYENLYILPNTFKEIYVKPKKVVEKEKVYHLLLCE